MSTLNRLVGFENIYNTTGEPLPFIFGVEIFSPFEVFWKGSLEFPITFHYEQINCPQFTDINCPTNKKNIQYTEADVEDSGNSVIVFELCRMAAGGRDRSFTTENWISDSSGFVSRKIEKTITCVEEYPPETPDNRVVWR